MDPRPDPNAPSTAAPGPDAPEAAASEMTAPEADRPADDGTVAMSQVAGPRPTALTDDPVVVKKKKEKTTVPMTEAGPSDGAIAKADQALADLGTKRGIETLFRSSYRVNMDLSALADAKANIMISINGLVTAILLGTIAPGIDRNPWLFLPTALFLLGCLVSLVYAILAARPRVQSQVVTRESALQNRTNVLFFGNFSHLTQDDFVFVMKHVVQDPTQIYTMMMKDIYGVGSVLQKKYKMLRASYTAFLAALVLGVIGFLGVFAWTTTFEDPPPGTTTIETQPQPPAGTNPVAPGILP